MFHHQRTKLRSPLLGLLMILAMFAAYHIFPITQKLRQVLYNDRQYAEYSVSGNAEPTDVFKTRGKTFTERRLEGLLSRGPKGWFSLKCDKNKPLRRTSISTSAGNLTYYIYDTASEDLSATKRALKGWFYEKKEIAKFLDVSGELPLIDVGANLGLVTLQAAMQRRQVVALEPVDQNVIRLCRAVLDFGHAPLVKVIQNAASSEEGNVTLAMGSQSRRTMYEVTGKKKWGYGRTDAYAIHLDRLLEILPFKRAALKIDVEGHEGHVLAGAEKLFQEVDIPVVWLEWMHVKKKPQYGGEFIIQFMSNRRMEPFNLMTGELISHDKFLQWPKTVLWKRADAALT
ncbi:uncharacterized protein LOC143286433 [Babylonia areolata]|uniref:uncharacterized protein LOC143286433 n=1 Tax=Babylonia areolata TaxID=304850 RepID=UPI003FD1B859